jgi:enoyl-[acyl-carrier protein] reductase I
MQALMQDKRGLIMGVANDHSIAWGIAKTLAAHGAELGFTFQGEALGKRVKPLAAAIGAKLVMPCDVENIASVDATFETVKKEWAGSISSSTPSRSPTRTSSRAATPTPRARTSCAP